eukprot:TRINITY_DN1521_c0_g2_i1.p1 TRINITY_DN1521_c0_g2~~TRINITY_DN1521_c0_g2_i1.p1  ORF type:complete len:619 (+),score=186.77 TRINITY_DN1521_c0_g2_i1:112-1968(+)
MAGGETRLAVICIASAVVLIRTAILCDDTHCKDYHGWALACGCVSFVLCLTLLLIKKFNACNVDSFMKWIALFLLLWWIAGCGCMTFERPYKITGNGYFGAWGALIFSWLLCIEHWPVLKTPLEAIAAAAGSIFVALLLLASAVVLVQTAVDCDEYSDADYCKNEVAWVLACSVVSLVVVIVVIIFAEKVASFWKWIALFLFLWWCAGTGVATFDRPYEATGNGYFGCWAAVIAAAILCAQAFGQDLGENADAALEKGAGMLGSKKEIVGVCLASLVVLIQAGVDCDGCEDYHAWALACAVISFVICVVLIVLSKFQLANVEPFMKWIALFLAVWWLAGTWCMTFKRPFKLTGNGYFGAWAAVVFAWVLCFAYWPEVNEPLKKIGSHGKEIAILTLASLVVGVQAAMDCDDSNKCEEQLAWAVACGWISFVLCLIIIFLFDKISQFFKWIVLFLFLWWSAGAGVLTFDKPYIFTGNGYFGSWVAFLMTALLLMQQFGFKTGTGEGGAASGGASGAGGGLGAPHVMQESPRGQGQPASNFGSGEPANPVNELPQKTRAPEPLYAPEARVLCMWEGGMHPAKIWQVDRTPDGAFAGTYTVVWDEDNSHSEGIPESSIRAK